jgi:endonuclease/exonuclease/phosphatase family metal-dependent hydrolase
MLSSLALVISALAAPAADRAPAGPVVIRVATFNVEDVRTEDLRDPAHARLRRLAEVIQRIRPNIILLNEVAYDMKGAPGYKEGDPEGQNGQRFADTFLAVAQATDVKPIKYKAFTAPSNTGLFSGFDLDRDGKVTNTYPAPPGTKPDGSPGDQTPEGRAFGNDCWGFGTFPGQYAMTLLVDERLTIDTEHVRTFQLYPWDYMPGNLMPLAADGTDWYAGEAKTAMRLSSKSLWDVPVKLPNGVELRVLCSHPTPPAFDGPEMRNKRRNHDEIRLIRDYIDNLPGVVDDKGLEGGLIMRKEGPLVGVTIPFVVLGDLNADPKDGDSFRSPIAKMLFKSRHVNSAVVPESDVKVEGLDPWDTAMFKLRVDYALPSKSVKVLNSGVWRHAPVTGKPASPVNATPGSPAAPTPAALSTDKPAFPSDHFPVWIEIEVPAPDPVDVQK